MSSNKSQVDSPGQSAGVASGKKGLSLAAKLNIIIVAMVVLVAGGLMMVGFKTYSDRVDRVYYERLDNASTISAYLVNPKGLAFLWNHVDTDEYRAIHERAIENDDPALIGNWLKGIDACEVYSRDGSTPSAASEHITLYDAFEDYLATAEYVAKEADITWVYFQYMEDGVTYTLVDPEHGLLGLGSIELPLPEFEQYGDNERIPATVYQSPDGWLCTAGMPIVDDETNEAVGMICFDADMNQVMQERQGFFFNSIAFVALVTIAAMMAGLVFMRRIVSKPLRQLTDATCGFCESFDAAGTLDESLNAAAAGLDIRSNDEIGDLYREIRAMQGRISDYAQNLASVSAKEERERTELEMAAGIQDAMLPNVFPAFPECGEFDIYASMTPAKDIGGDFYDFSLIDDDHLMFAIADVSGKGVPAALYMMAVKIMLADRSVPGVTPAQILREVNVQICENNTTRTFVTVWLAILDINTGEVICANAGHDHPWIRSADGTFRMLRDKHGLVIGAAKNMEYIDYTIKLEPGDAIFVHTDGVTEAMNPAREFFGAERLGATLNAHAGESPEAIIRSVAVDVDAFAGDAGQFDDITMLCLEYKGAAAKPDELTVEATFGNIDRATDFVMQKLDGLGCPMKEKTQVAVAIDEILSNISKFAYAPGTGNVTVGFSASRTGASPGEPCVVELTFTDSGHPYNPTEAPAPDITLPASQRTVGGLGMLIVSKTMDDIEYAREHDKNILRLRKSIPLEGSREK